jgi:hypothetical protein
LVAGRHQRREHFYLDAPALQHAAGDAGLGALAVRRFVGIVDEIDLALANAAFIEADVDQIAAGQDPVAEREQGQVGTALIAADIQELLVEYRAALPLGMRHLRQHGQRNRGQCQAYRFALMRQSDHSFPFLYFCLARQTDLP